MTRTRARALLAGAALLLTAVAPLSVPTALADPPVTSTTPSFGDADGIHVVAAQQADPRLWKLSVSTAALGRAVRVDVLLPSAYASDPGADYPVLYLFHGTSGGADDWVDYGDVEATTAGLPLIVVMPDAGFDNDGGGWFTNWWDTGTALGPSQWETFHIDQLIPWVDANLRTVATRSGRAIAGLSQGGFGAFSYAARHPELFAAAGAFSGAPAITINPVVELGATAIIEGTAFALDQVEPAAMFGPHLTNELNWQGHDPARLVQNLAGVNLSLYTASGIPGALDGPQPNLSAMGIEQLSHISTLAFAQAAKDAGVPYYLDDYVFGTHTFPYWARDLRDFVPRLMSVFANPAPAPATVSYRSVDKTWTQWGWTVANQRTAALCWSQLSGAGPGGFTLTGSSPAAVTTPPVYLPGSTHAVRIATSLGTSTVSVRADASGSLTVTVNPATLLLTSGSAAVTIS